MRKILTLLTVLILGILSAHAQSRTVKGKVVDNSGKPLDGVSVIIKGTTRGTTTSIDGSFGITASANDVLVISSVNSGSTEVSVGSRDNISITLNGTASNLSEVIVTTGLGVRRQAKSLGYSTATVTSQELTQARVTNVANGLAAKVAGVDIRLANNGINPAVKITFRGNRSITGNNTALVIVDGNPVDQAYINTINPDDIENESILKGPNAAAIYGKDAANGVLIITTKHGKKGTLSVNYRNTTMFEQVSYMPKLQNEYSPYGGERSPYNDPSANGCIGCVPSIDPLTGKPLPIPFENQNYGPAYNSLDFPYTQIAVGLDTNGNIKYAPYSGVKNGRRNFFQTGLSEQNDLSVSKGGKIGSFFVSGSNVVNKGVVPTEKYERNTVTGNGTLTFGKFEAAGGLTYSTEKINQVGLGYSGANQYRPVYWSVINQPPNVDLSTVKNVDTDPYASFQGYTNAYYPNPWYQVNHSHINPFTHNVIANLTLNYQILPWLKLTARGGYNKRTREIESSIDSIRFRRYSYGPFKSVAGGLGTYDPWGGGATASTTSSLPYQYEKINTSLTDRNADGYFTITKTIKDFGGSLIGGVNYRSSNSSAYWYSNQSTTVSAIPSGYTKVANADGTAYETLAYKYRQQSAYGDLNLNYKEFIYLHGSYRNDWISVLDPKTRSFNYYGADASVVLIETGKNRFSPNGSSDFLSFLKLRGGYSVTGNASLAASASGGANAGLGYLYPTSIPTFGAYAIYPTVSVGTGFPYGNLNGYSLSTVAVQNQLQPEKDFSSEVGVELGFLKNRIGLEVTLYNTDAKNQNLPVQTSQASGINSFTLNGGSVNSRGYEISLNLNPLIKVGKFNWSGKVNFAQQDNKVKSLIPGSDTLLLVNGTTFAVAAITGQAFPTLLVKDFIRDPQGHIIVDGLSGLPTPDPTLKNAGNTSYKYFLGLQSNMSYQRFTFNMVWDYRGGAKILNSVAQALGFAGISEQSATNREHFVVPNSVIYDGSKYVPNTNIAITGDPTTWWFGQYANVQSPYVVSANFWKLREVSLGYDIPVHTQYIKRLNFAVVGQNLLMIRPKTNEYTDPEFSAQGVGNAIGYTSEYQTPPTRRFGFTLSASF